MIAAGSAAGTGPALLLLHTPALNKAQVVFSYAGDLWTVLREGGSAVRLTSGQGFESNPVFSPDGSTVAFTAEYDGNVDIYTVPASGGIPQRITHHPNADYAAGWTPDGQRILFRSNRRSSTARYTQLFTVEKTGGRGQALPLPMAFSGAYSPDGKRMVYAPLDGGQFGRTPERFVAWKRYRGGEASYLWIVNLGDLSIEKIPRTDSKDINPMWIGNKIYFLSDRNGPMTLFSYDLTTKAVTEVIGNTGHDIRAASEGPGAIVYERFGGMGIYDLATGKTRDIPVQVEADLTEIRPHFQNVEHEIRNVSISPTGVRAAVEAHGEILTVPADKGDIRNLTRTAGVMERTPAWSPDGQSIAYFSDESGEYALHVAPQTGAGPVRKIALPGSSTFYFGPVWSPDSKQLAFSDNQLNLWRLEIATAAIAKIDTDIFYGIGMERDLAWSPDSKWIAFAKFLPNYLHAIELFSVASSQTIQVTDGISDARYPAFDSSGQYLYFTASTNAGTSAFFLDMTSDDHRLTRTVYAAVLDANAASPIAPESDEEKLVDGKPVEEKKASEPAVVRIDLADLQQRVVALPIPARHYERLAVGKAGQIYLLEETSASLTGEDDPDDVLWKFDLKSRKTEKLGEHVGTLDISANGEKMLLGIVTPASAAGGSPDPQSHWAIVSANAPWKPEEGTLHTSSMEVRVDPPAEWQQMFKEVWRIERGYFYDSKLHGVDAATAEKEYEPYVSAAKSRDDLNYIFQEMLSEITSSHLRGGGGTLPRGKRVPGGLLGADYEIAGGHYRFQHVYTGESWNPQLRAPLSGPGVSVKTGEYLFAINGRPVVPADDIDALLEDTAEKRVTLRVGVDPNGADARDVVVAPVASEQALRNLAWVETNRRKVDQLSGGKLAYVYMPDTGEAGLTSFNRYFFAQVEKEGLILDERFNGGGQVADHIIDVLNRPLLAWSAPRYGGLLRSPTGSIQGPKVMIVNELAGSGGDMMPWMFRYTKTGTLVGKRTWGGLIGILEFPGLMDGGTITAPNIRLFSPEGEWIAENTGVTPDVEVELDPRTVASGHDPQLERAVQIALEQLKKNPPRTPKQPPYPDYQHSSARTSP
jgi:tricorn protease